MADFNRNRRPSGGRSFGGGNRSFGNRDRDRQMYPATCGKCGKACEVPFRPSGDRPVLCSDCFRESGGPQERRSEGRNFSRPQFDNRRGSNQDHSQYKEQLETLNQKLDKILNILAPNTPKPQPAEEKETEAAQVEEHVIVPEKKKRTKKVVPLTPEEQL